MKIISFIIPAFLMISCQIQNKSKSNATEIELNKNWLFSEAGSNNWLPATIPGSVHTDLLANQLIDDPFYRLNEHKLQWIDKKDWEYKTTFSVENQQLNAKNIELEFEGLDTYADVYLNDTLILKANNMFRSWKVDCKKQLKPGENVLRILFHSPTLKGLELLEENGYPLPASNDQSEIGEMGNKQVSIFVRKAPYHFGWDWGPRLVTSGIWRTVNLIAWNEAKIENLHVIQKKITDSVANLTAEIEIISSADQKAEFVLSVNGLKNSIASKILTAGTEKYFINFTITNPQLWWPNGLGEQPLYNISIDLLIDGKTIDNTQKNVGLRTLKLVQEPDITGDGKSYYFIINGRPVFAKGANYIPNDVFLSRISKEKYIEIISSAAEANMNMLRVWGGGIYENDLFYELCDRYGILVWQDFMFACSMYPGDEAFLENVWLEAEENVKRLRDHPCLALWCGNNEIEIAWAEYNEKSGWSWKEQYAAEQRKEIWQAYDTLFHKILPSVVNEHAPGQFYWHSSPSAGMGKLATFTSNSGDMHYWGVWHGGQPFSDFRKYKARFMSEYGFQSFPEMESVQKYTLPKDLNIESKVMASHQRNGIGNLRIKQYMETNYQVPDDFEQFLYVGQLLQAEAIKTAIESHRSEMPYCMGSLYWQLNDCWPVASWSGIDYYGRWKALHYFVKKSFKNVIISSVEENEKLNLYCVSDFENKLKAKLNMQLMDFDGNLLWQDSLSFVTPTNSSSIIYQIDFSKLIKIGDTTKMVLLSEMQSSDSTLFTDLHYFVQPKNLTLEKPELTTHFSEGKETFSITISSNKLVKNIFLSAGDFPGKFSDNFFDLLPQKVYTVSIPKQGSLADFKQKIKLLHLQQTMK